MEFPENLLYSDTHEWIRDEGGRVTIGLTDYAQSQLKDIIYVDLPEENFERDLLISLIQSELRES